MLSLSISKILRKNSDEVIRRWLEYTHGRVAEDFEQMLNTPMGTSVANKLLGGAADFFTAEDYREPEFLRQARQISYDASFRRAAVGYCLPDIVTTCQTFHQAIRETVLNNFLPGTDDEWRELLDAVLALSRLENAAIMGRIAGYFAYHEFGGHDEDEERIAG